MAKGTEVGNANAPAELISRDALDLPEDFIPPHTETERRIAEIWREVFCLDRVGIRDNFFDLGGDSFTASVIATQIEERLSVAFENSLFMRCMTVEEIAAHLSTQKQQKATASKILVPVRPSGSRAPLFLVHGAQGIIFLDPAFFEHIDPEIPVYVFYARGIDGQEPPGEAVEAIAQDYLAAMRAIYPNGPYLIGGVCAGSLVALEMAQRLRRRGEDVRLLTLIDPPMMPVAVEKRFSLRALYNMRNQRRHPFHLKLAIWSIMLMQRWRWLNDVDDPVDATIFQRIFGKFFGRPVPDIEERYIRRLREGRTHGELVFESEAVRRVAIALRKAWTRYEPQFYEGNVTVIASRRRAKFIEDPDYFWKSILPHMSVSIITETHAGVLRKNAEPIARAIQSAIDRTGGRAQFTRKTPREADAE